MLLGIFRDLPFHVNLHIKVVHIVFAKHDNALIITANLITVCALSKFTDQVTE